MRTQREIEALRTQALLQQVGALLQQRLQVLPAVNPMAQVLGSHDVSGAYDAQGQWVSWWKVGQPVGSAPVGP